VKLVFFSTGDSPAQMGVQQANTIAAVDWNLLGTSDELQSPPRTLVDLIQNQDVWMRALVANQDLLFACGRPLYKVGKVKVHAPYLPSTVLCAGSNYAAHNREKAGAPLSGKEPEFFIKTADCVIGPEEPIVHDPILTRKLDCEVELAIIIGRAGRHIPVKHALKHVFGYSIVNDVTARDRQVRRNADGVTWYELGRGKVFDGSCPFGPCIVTTDDIPDPQNLYIRSRVNGELRQAGNTRDMIWSCAELVHFFSVNLTLRPGMVIITGTPAGTAWSADTELGGHWIQAVSEDGEQTVAARSYSVPGDTIDCEIERIGVLRNSVASAMSD
jgi:2-keto-4-pentenoate hydratase/2-oxohepta-3-ene-1,7-dioic acid hydratase in catechol pathway